jgi:phosphoribosylformylglycinamidine synthase
VSDGGLAVALAECTFGQPCGVSVSLDACSDLRTPALLFAESHSRFVVSIRPEDQRAFERIMGRDAQRLGVVTEPARLVIRRGPETLIDVPTQQLLEAWNRSFSEQTR